MRVTIEIAALATTEPGNRRYRAWIKLNNEARDELYRCGMREGFSDYTVDDFKIGRAAISGEVRLKRPGERYWHVPSHFPDID